MEITKVLSDSDLEWCLLIRKKVFVDEQNVPIADEIDGLDPDSDHYIMKSAQNPVGTLRVRHTQRMAKIERVALLPPYRGKGLGRKFMSVVMEIIVKSGTADQITLGAQTHVIGFYEKLGFNICSDEYTDAGIPHREMCLVLPSSIDII